MRSSAGRGGRKPRAQRAFGAAVLAVGAILVAVVAVRMLRGSVARERARAEWTKVMKSSTMSAIASLGLTRVSSGAPVVRVIIPSIRLDEVVVEGLKDKDLWAGPGHMPGTVFPGQNGNSVISAHRDRHFHRLDDVRVGDMIETQTPLMSVMWRITQRRVVGKDEAAIFEAQTPMLTLTTCWPTRYVGPAPDRLLLTAEPVSMRERETGPQAVPAAASPSDSASH
jgi:sortase A